MMYVYIQSEPNLWTVGFYTPEGEWNPESDHSEKEEAAKRVAFLNGSNTQDNPNTGENEFTPVPNMLKESEPSQRIKELEDMLTKCRNYIASLSRHHPHVADMALHRDIIETLINQTKNNE